MEYLFKYRNIEDSLKILNNQSLRYSKPYKFNDPFDCNIDLVNNYSNKSPNFIADFGEEVLKTLGGAVKKFDPEVFIKAFNADPKFSEDKVNQGIDNMAKYINTFIKKGFNADNCYILCLTGTHNNLLMWSHYAQDHAGVVFKFKKIKELDNLIVAAQKVHYSENLPDAINIGSFVKNRLGKMSDLEVIQGYCNNLFLTKSIDWKYEDEYRVIIWEEASRSKTDHQDHPLYKQEIDSVFFGCKIIECDKKNIVSLIKTKYPETKMFQMKMSSSKFGLDEERIY